jgi:hypothetical protein
MKDEVRSVTNTGTLSGWSKVGDQYGPPAYNVRPCASCSKWSNVVSETHTSSALLRWSHQWPKRIIHMACRRKGKSQSGQALWPNKRHDLSHGVCVRMDASLRSSLKSSIWMNTMSKCTLKGLSPGIPITCWWLADNLLSLTISIIAGLRGDKASAYYFLIYPPI